MDPILQPALNGADKYGAAVSARKKCKKCGEIREATEFYKETRTDGTKNTCKPCYNVLLKSSPRYKEWRTENSQSIKEYAKRKTKEWREAERAKDPLGFMIWQRLHSVRSAAKRYRHAPCTATIEFLKATYTETCQCCGISGRKTVIDHCHETGEFRGWICNWCNSLLGHAQDDVNTLRMAIEYLGRK